MNTDLIVLGALKTLVTGLLTVIATVAIISSLSLLGLY